VRALGDEHFRYGESGAASAGTAVGPWNQLAVGGWSIATVLMLALGWALLRPEAPRQVLRYSMPFPAVTVGDASTSWTRIAVAPDGDLVVVLLDADDVPQLWVRRRAALDLIQLSGTDGAHNPFFSPDGSRLGFMVDGPPALKLGSIGGGLPTTVPESDAAVGGSGTAWGPDGYLYTSTSRGGLVRLATGGGTRQSVTTIQRDQGEIEHLWPDVLPNGRGVLFTVLKGYRGSNDIGVNDIAVVELSTGVRRTLLRGAEFARYAQSGHLLYVTADGTLMATPFDQEAMVITGGATAVAEGLRVGNNAAVDLAISPSGTLVYATVGSVGVTNVYSPVWVDRDDGSISPVETDWVVNMLDFGGLSLSPDGTRLAFQELDSVSGRSDIYLKELPGGLPRKFTFEGASNRRPTWSPDGQSVLFISDRGGQDDVWEKRIDGTRSDRMVDRERAVFEALWSPDGEWLLYRTDDDQATSIGRGDILAFRPEGDTVPREIVATPFEETSPTLSPNGRWLAYSSDRTGQTGRREVFVQPFPDAEDRFWQISADGGIEPTWSRDGTEVFYRNAAGILIAARVEADSTFELQDRVSLFDAGNYLSQEDNRWYAESADGERFLFFQPVASGQSPNSAELIVVQNFFEELNRLVPN